MKKILKPIFAAVLLAAIMFLVWLLKWYILGFCIVIAGYKVFKGGRI